MDCHTEGESLKFYHEDTNLETTFPYLFEPLPAVLIQSVS